LNRYVLAAGSKVEVEKEADDSEQFIEISEGKDVRLVTTRQKSREQSPKVAENDTPKLGMTGKEKVKNELTEKGDKISMVPHYTTTELRDTQKADDNLTFGDPYKLDHGLGS
jgi:uroporphyrinogen-III synthase